MSIYQVEPCPPEGAGGEDPTPRLDAEVLILCDVSGGTVVGYALAVYKFNDVTGSYVGPVALLDPVTGAPYFVQGVLQVCPTASGGGGVAETVSLSAGTLAALESINAAVSGTVAVSNFPSSVEISNDTGFPIPVSGAVALDAATLAALENITVGGTVAVSNFPTTTEISNDAGNPIPVSGTVTITDGAGPVTVDGTVNVGNFPATQPVTGTVALDAPTLAALETITAIISGAVALDAATLAALESISAVVSGTVAVSNFPASVEVSNDTGSPLPISGTVALDSSSLAALETITALLGSSTAFAGFMGDAEQAAVNQGRYRFAGAKIPTSVTSPTASITLVNPVGSNVDLILMRYQVEVDAAADVVLMTDSESTGTVAEAMNPNLSISVANPGEVRTGSGVLTGGVVSSVIRRAQPNSPVAVGPFRFRIPPGRTFSIRFLGPSATNTVWMNVGWFVVPVGGDLL